MLHTLRIEENHVKYSLILGFLPFPKTQLEVVGAGLPSKDASCSLGIREIPWWHEPSKASAFTPRELSGNQILSYLHQQRRLIFHQLIEWAPLFLLKDHPILFPCFYRKSRDAPEFGTERQRRSPSANLLVHIFKRARTWDGGPLRKGEGTASRYKVCLQECLHYN